MATVEIHLNRRRLDWPDYIGVEVEDGETTVADLRARRPDALPITHQLYVLTADERWERLAPDGRLYGGRRYHLRAEISDQQRQECALRCEVCGTAVETWDALRYHPGPLMPQEWHYTTTRWEWGCCARIVSHQVVAAFTTSDGCTLGHCAQCRDLSAYHRAIAQHQDEIDAL